MHVVWITGTAVATSGPGLYTRGVWTSPPVGAERGIGDRAFRAAQMLRTQPGPALYLDATLLSDRNAPGEVVDTAMWAGHVALALSGKASAEALAVVEDAYRLRDKPDEVVAAIKARHPRATVVIAPGEWAERLRLAGIEVRLLA